MQKKMVPVFAFVLAALIPDVFAQSTSSVAVPIDVILRDFPVSDPGFERFDGEEGARGVCGGSDASRRNTQTTSKNAICFTNAGDYGYCEDLGLSSCIGSDRNDSCSNHLRYGTNSGDTQRGYCNGPDQNRFNCNGWNNFIYVTRDMVKKTLYYDTKNCPSELIIQAPEGEAELPDFLKYRYCARPQRGNDACHGEGVENWFTDGNHTRTFRDTIMLEEQRDGTYLIDFGHSTSRDWNGYGTDNGYFPLDKYEGQDDIYGRRIFGMQSLNYWCPNRNGTGCSDWWRYGGPKVDTAARAAAPRSSKRHNYGFSMMGSASFKYQGNSTDVFEFIGDDDMWIFIDGELVADLGGIHLASPAKIRIENLAREKGWEPGSMHAVNFFYLDRQTNGSNLRLRVGLNEMSSSIFVGPYIKEAKTVQNSDGTSKTTIYVNVRIDKSRLDSIINSNNFPIIITTSDPADKDIRGFKLDSISGPEYLGPEKGYAYVIHGQVCKAPNSCGELIISSGDSLSFNVLREEIRDGGYRDNGFALPSDKLYVIAESNKRPANKIEWAPNTTILPPIDFEPKPGDNIPYKPPFEEEWFTGNPNGGANGGGITGGYLEGPGGKGLFFGITKIWDPKTKEMVPIPPKNHEVHGFGTKGIAIPPQRAGELILTALPFAGGSDYKLPNGMTYKEWQDDEKLQKLFGLPPVPEAGKFYGIADPTVPSTEEGYIFVKNGFPGESSAGGQIQVAPTRCISDRSDPDKPRINCLNFSLLAKQPFRIVVTVYDQLGTFVTQYREEVNELEFRSVVQGPSYVTGSGIEKLEVAGGCKKPTSSNYGHDSTMTINGLVNVNVNIYPFSKDGRRFGNGVYLLKIDRVDLPYSGCVNSGGNAGFVNEPFVRYHADTKFGWARGTGPKEKAK